VAFDLAQWGAAVSQKPAFETAFWLKNGSWRSSPKRSPRQAGIESLDNEFRENREKLDTYSAMA